MRTYPVLASAAATFERTWNNTRRPKGIFGRVRGGILGGSTSRRCYLSAPSAVDRPDNCAEGQTANSLFCSWSQDHCRSIECCKKSLGSMVRWGMCSRFCYVCASLFPWSFMGTMYPCSPGFLFQPDIVRTAANFHDGTVLAQERCCPLFALEISNYAS